MFGAAAELMVGTPIDSIFPQEHRGKAAELLGRSFTTGEVIPFEFEHRDDHGMFRELIATFSPVVTDTGERIGASASIRDITHRINIQRQLDESRKMAALGTLAGTIAHHFNNVLGGIVTSADFAAESENRSVMKRVLQQVGQSLMRSTKLVNGLLAFSEGNQHADDLSDFTEIVYFVAEDFEAVAQKSGIAIKLNVATLPIMPYPRVQLMTVLKNIATNAIEAMPKGGTLSIIADAERDIAYVDIVDTGCGLDEISQSRIFEPFFTTKADAVGSPGQAVGLGLAIAHGLVQVLGGTITVRSALGQGSTFRVALPRPDVR
jgi:PAS domain S-box-containing protein